MKNHLSQGKASKESRPLLANVSVYQFRRDEPLVYYRETAKRMKQRTLKEQTF